MSLAKKVNLDHFSAVKLVYFLQIHLFLMVRKNEGSALINGLTHESGLRCRYYYHCFFFDRKIIRNEKRSKLPQSGTGQNNLSY